VWTLTNAAAPARAVQLVAELGVADLVEGEPMPAALLADSCGVAAEPLDRVLRLLAAHGVFEWTGVGYRHNEASRLLRSDIPRSMRDFARMMGLPVMWSAFAELDRSVRTGAPVFDHRDDGGFFGYLGGHPQEERVFAGAMTAKAQADIATLLDAYDFRRFATIADIGGGRGHLLRAVLDAVPTARRGRDGARRRHRPPHDPRRGLLLRPAARGRPPPPHGGHPRLAR
jgi:hypothetical protein